MIRSISGNHTFRSKKQIGVVIQLQKMWIGSTPILLFGWRLRRLLKSVTSGMGSSR